MVLVRLLILKRYSSLWGDVLRKKCMPIQCVKKNQRNENGKAFPSSIEELTILQLFTDLEKKPLSLCDVQIFTDNALKTKRGELANSGEAVQFLTSKNEVNLRTFTLFF